MICKKQLNILDKLCQKYGLSYKVFYNTGNILIETPLEQYIIEVHPEKKQNNIRLKHKNRLNNINQYHTQRYFNAIHQAIDAIVRHKGMKIIYKNLNNFYNNNENRELEKIGT